MHYLIYKITNLINDKIYIGAHVTDNINDGYMGSGTYIKKAINMYGVDKFKKEILYVYDNKNDMFNKEREIVNETFIKQKNTYNAKVGGTGGYSAENKEEWKQNISIAQKKRFSNGAQAWNKGKKVSEEELILMKNRMVGKMVGTDNPMYGKPCYYKMTPDEKNTWSNGISKGNTGKKRTDEHKKNYSAAAAKRRWLIHKDGTLTHTSDETDYRLNHPDWQNGKKWKN